ncbi:MAG: NAD(P)/FAD-dependent oxidoreductase [Candidatus Nanoarchaeia archaeon]|jgi:geranylgeranyl reductase family protein
MKDYDYLIIGAGPAGSYLAEKLASKGFKVGLSDKKRVIGKPIQCTGLVTKELEKYVSVKEDYVKNVTHKINLFSKNDSITLKSKEYVIDRFEFDTYLLKKAENAGAEIMLGNEFKGQKNGNIILSKNNFKTKNLIGCDGPASQVNKCFNIIKGMKYFLGKQYVIKIKNNPEAYNVYFDEFFHDFFAWSVPAAKNISRIGVASKDNDSINKKLKYFMDSRKIKGKIIETNAGLIPVFNPFNSNYSKTKDLNIYLFGDASGLVKATTGGGIIPAFKSINESMKSIILGKKPLLFGLKKELTFHLLAHKMMCKFKDKDYDSILNDAKSISVKKSLEKLNRDNFASLAVDIFMKNPKLIKYFKLC